MVDSVRVMKVANPAIGTVYRCVVDNGMGNDTISLQISKTWITPSFLVRRDSLSHWISLRNSSQITGSVFSGQTWQIGKPGGSDNNNKSTDYESQKWVDTCVDLENAIMTDSFGVEANDCYRIPYIPDGLRQSVRLGYMYKNSYYTIKAEKIRYAFTVDSSNAILLLHYSFFLSVGHSFIRNDYDPQFGIYVRDTSGKTLYYYGVGAMDSGRYNVCRIRPPSVMNDLRIIYTPWKLSAVNLSPYIGKEVELIFYVSNCWQGTGMHFGLAYVVPECRPAKIDVQYCSSDKVARLSAPEGFAAYEWTDSSGKVVGSQQRLRIVGPCLVFLKG